ncbi:adiponectin receptor [Angomonas deanei]|uniref:Haemolysin-III related, putative n=1 Tax=Angomonas deanei TaxID=59799 RepID=S9WGZ4_9TRYP|nr:adiponectin receptor [Angomonas deanei]EPY35035.1 adiponectin receptor [Angomonas deanei]CAD2213149.1 Haemolysin-III related, putative [Angomonas deanei]|eukprot:EPY24319.1 adiponectin receptor [Angomonas deanei]
MPTSTKRGRSPAKRSNSKGGKTPRSKLPTPHNDDKDYPLYYIDQVPEYLRDNQYILSHYRAYYSFKACVGSLFRLHNETFNIWTHLLGGMYFVYLIYDLYAFLFHEYSDGNGVSFTKDDQQRVVLVSRNGNERTAMPFIIFGLYSFGCLCCMFCSACFHTFLCHLSTPAFRFAHALDYFGITALTVGSFIPFCNYAFACDPEWGVFYLKMIGCFGVVGMLGPFFRRWTSQAFATKKILFYVAMVGSGIIPTLHMLRLPETPIRNPAIKGLLQMLAFYGVGVFIYAFKLPEIFSPGTFDVYFHSHQIWHVFVLAAALTHFYNAVQMYKGHNNDVTCAR